MNKVKCFWLEPAGKIQHSLRRYQSSSRGQCVAGEYSYQNASILLNIIDDPNPYGVIGYRIKDEVTPVKIRNLLNSLQNVGDSISSPQLP